MLELYLLRAAAARGGRFSCDPAISIPAGVLALRFASFSLVFVHAVNVVLLPLPGKGALLVSVGTPITDRRGSGPNPD